MHSAEWKRWYDVDLNLSAFPKSSIDDHVIWHSFLSQIDTKFRDIFNHICLFCDKDDIIKSEEHYMLLYYVFCTHFSISAILDKYNTYQKRQNSPFPAFSHFNFDNTINPKRRKIYSKLMNELLVLFGHKNIVSLRKDLRMLAQSEDYKSFYWFWQTKLKVSDHVDSMRARQN